MTEAERSSSISVFEKDIFPIWKSIERRDIEAENKMSMDEIAELDILAECVTLHKQDLAIHRSGIKPNMMGMEQEKASNMYTKVKNSSLPYAD